MLVALGHLGNVTHLLEDGQAKEARELLKIRPRETMLTPITPLIPSEISRENAGHGSQWISNKINIRHPGQLKK